MKKFISSVLVITLMGVPAVSSAFATNNEEILADLNSQKQQIEESLDNLYEELVGDAERFGENYDKEFFAKREKELWEEFGKVESLIKDTEKNLKETKEEPNVSENTQNEVAKNKEEPTQTKEEQEIKETEQKKTGKSTTKKVLITGGITIGLAILSYIAYNYCPFVQEFVNNTAIPYAKDLGNKMVTSCNDIKTKANSCYESVKNFTGDTAKSLSNKANKYYDSVKNFMSDTAESLSNKANEYYESVKDFTNEKAIPYIKNLGKNIGKKLTEQYVAIKALSCFASVKNYITSKVKSLENKNVDNQENSVTQNV